MDLPSFIGMEASESISKLLDYTDNYNLIIKRTKSPKDKETILTECRIIRQRVYENNIEIIVSYF